MNFGKELHHLQRYATKRPAGLKPLYCKAMVDLSLELHVPPQTLHQKMKQLESLNTPRIQQLWQPHADLHADGIGERDEKLLYHRHIACRRTSGRLRIQFGCQDWSNRGGTVVHPNHRTYGMGNSGWWL